MAIPATLSTVPAQTPYIQYVATSGQTVFPYPFEITQDSDLVVVANGTTLATDSGYTVSGVGASTGGNVTFTSGRTAGDIITLYRDIAISRVSQIAQNSGFSSTVFNAEYNNIYLLLQQLQSGIDQCLQIPNTNNPAPAVSLTPGAYANKYLAFDANGNPEPADLTSSGSLTGSILAGILSTYTAQAVLPPNVRTDAEIAAGVTPTNYTYAPGVVDRYGTNTTPGTTDMTAAIQAALSQAAQAGGAVVQLLGTTYLTSSTLNILPNTVVQGAGRGASTIKYTGTGDAIKSSQPINSSTAVRIAVRDLYITCTNASSAGAAYDDVGGTYWVLQNVRTSGFKFGVICDQSEIAAIRDCEFLIPAIANAAGIWLVNGADHTALANTLFTNRITIDACQFNAATGVTNYGIVDDGGSNHTISNNNVNAPSIGMRFANTFGLIVSNTESEGCPSVDIILDETTAGIGLLGSAYAGPVVGFSLTGNTWISNGVSHNLRLSSARNGDVRGNVFGQGAGSCISFFGGAGNPCSGIVIEGNEKLIYGPGKTAAPFFAATTLAVERANKLRQVPMTYVATALAASGSQTVTPQSMENIHVGSRLICRNTDGTNTEEVTVTAVTGTTFTATFANTHNVANWLVCGITGWDEEEGTWTPVLAGSTTPGSNTYGSDTVGKYSRRGNLVKVSGVIDVTAKDGSMAGALQINGLPYPVANVTNQNGMSLVTMFSGFTFAAGFTQMGGFIAPGASNIGLRKSGSGVALTTVPATDIASTTCLIYFDAVYETDAA